MEEEEEDTQQKIRWKIQFHYMCVYATAANVYGTHNGGDKPTPQYTSIIFRNCQQINVPDKLNS